MKSIGCLSVHATMRNIQYNMGINLVNKSMNNSKQKHKFINFTTTFTMYIQERIRDKYHYASHTI